MCNDNLAYKKLEKNLTDIIAEGQAKLGYQEGPIKLYYPLGSLNHFFNSKDSVEDMENRLAKFVDFVSDRLGAIDITHKEERFCFNLPPEASEYVYNNKEKNMFIFELVELLQKKGTTLDSVIDLFKKWDNDCVIKEMNDEECDILIKFTNRDDPYYYCFKDEIFNVIYHRFLPEDFDEFGF